MSPCSIFFFRHFSKCSKSVSLIITIFSWLYIKYPKDIGIGIKKFSSSFLIQKKNQNILVLVTKVSQGITGLRVCRGGWTCFASIPRSFPVPFSTAEFFSFLWGSLAAHSRDGMSCQMSTNGPFWSVSPLGTGPPQGCTFNLSNL